MNTLLLILYLHAETINLVVTNTSTIPMRKVNGSLQQPIQVPPMPLSTNSPTRITQLANPPPPIPTDVRDKMRKWFKEGGQKGR